MTSTRRPSTRARGGTALGWAALVLATLLPACASSSQQARLSELQLRSRLDEFANQFSSALQRCSDEVLEVSNDPLVRRGLLRWQMYMTPACRRAAAGVNVQEAFVDVWTLCVQQLDFFANFGSGPDKPSDADTRVIREAGLYTSQILVQDIENIAALFLAPEQMDAARQDVTEFAAANPIDSRYTRLARLPSSTPHDSKDDFDWVGSIPLIGAFSGLDAGAKALSRLADVADDFTRTVEQLPESIRWQTSLVLYELDDLQSVQEVSRAADSMSQSAERIATTAEELPARTQQVLLQTVAAIESSQAELQRTLGEARAAVAETRDTVTAMDGTVQRSAALLTALDAAAGSVTRAAEAWESMVRSLDGESAPDGEPAPAPATDATAVSGTAEGFDPAAYGTAADSLTLAAVEVRGLVQEVRDLVRSDELARPLDEADQRARALVDLATLRLLQVTAGVLLAAVLYRLLGRWLPRSS